MEETILYISYFSLFAFVVAILLGSIIYIKFPHIALTRMFFNICLLLAAMNFIEFKLRISENETEAFIWSRLYAIWPFILATTLHFIIIFRKTIKHPIISYCSIYLPALIIFYIELTTNLISIKPVLTYWGYTIAPANGIFFYFSTIWTISILCLILYFSYKNYTSSFDNKKKQALLILIGLILNFIIGISTDLIFKIANINAPSVGYSYSIISFTLIAFSIKKYHLFVVTPESIAGKIISSISELVFLVNSKKQIIEINNSALHVLQYSKSEILGQSFEKIIYNSEDLCTTCCELISDKKSIEYEAILLTSDKNKIPISLSCNPISLNNKNDMGIVFIGKDITERKRFENNLKFENSKLEDLVSKRTENLSKINAQLLVEINKYEKTEKKILQTIQKLEDNERAKIGFFDNLAHEISTPVNAIIGFTDLLKDDTITKEDSNKFTSIIHNSSIQLQGIVKNIVSMATINNNKEIISLEEINCNYILQSLYIQFKPKADKQNIEFNCFKKLRDEDAIIISDQIKLTQIISNLLTNAFKFTREGHIHFGYTIATNRITFFVRDTGIGIEESGRKKIFERYSQGNPTISELYGGSGLGLSIAKTYVELLGGEIWLESEVNKGSTFNFWLPYTYKIEEIH